MALETRDVIKRVTAQERRKGEAAKTMENMTRVDEVSCHSNYLELTTLNEANRQEAFLASCMMAPFTRVEDILAHRRDGPGPSGSAAWLQKHIMIIAWHEPETKSTHSSKLSAHHAATQMLRNTCQMRVTSGSLVGGFLHKRSVDFHFVLCFSFFMGVARAAPSCLSNFEPFIHHVRPIVGKVSGVATNSPLVDPGASISDPARRK
jgi:hypothetical protein